MTIDFSAFIDIKIAILLWALGYAIKHGNKFKIIKNIPNDAIPILLFGVGIITACIEAGDVSINAVIIGIITAGFAIGIHSSGKNIFKLAEGTTIYATPESINNSVAKQEKEKKQQQQYIDNSNYTNSENYTSAVNDSLGDSEIILEMPNETGTSVG